MDLTVTDLREASEMIDPDVELGEGIQTAIRAFGAKATNYGALMDAQLAGAFGELPDIDGEGPIAAGFAVPMYYYHQFMTDNGLYDRIEALMAAPEWADPELRGETLEAFKDELRDKPVRQEIIDAVVARAGELFPGENIRFRSSTNTEDLGSFTGAGLYNSETGVPGIANDANDSVAWAMKKVWSQVWNTRAYEEREYFSIKHLDVGMALLVHANFPAEESQGVAITNNPYDRTGTLPAFFVNAQIGSNDVVTPDPGVTSDSYLHYFYNPGQPVSTAAKLLSRGARCSMTTAIGWFARKAITTTSPVRIQRPRMVRLEVASSSIKVRSGIPACYQQRVRSPVKRRLERSRPRSDCVHWLESQSASERLRSAQLWRAILCYQQRG